MDQISDFLFPFERGAVHPGYREYLEARRRNYANCVGCRDLWDLYMCLDQIWTQDITDARVSDAEPKSLSTCFYVNAHAKVRIAMELAFSCCMEESRSILRDAIEWAATAHYVLSDPLLVKVWAERNKNYQAFEKAFVWNKKGTLFKGLGQLHHLWRDLSEIGSHATVNAFCSRVRIEDVDTNKKIYRVRYTGLEARMWIPELFNWLGVCSKLEATMFADNRDRLQFDEHLVELRKRFDVERERVRTLIREDLGIEKPPEDFVPAWRR